MYKEFYGFSEEPFALNPDPRFLFLTEDRKEVLDSLVYGITERKGFILLTGELGTGKTTLIHQLIPMLDPKIKALLIYQPFKTFDELLEVILRDLNLPLGERSKSFMLSQLNEYLFQRSAQDETLLIIVDEAQDLSEEVMEELRLLCNPDPRRPRFIQQVLVGQPEIEDKLNSWELRQLQQRIAIRRHLKPLTEEESRQYIEYRLGKVGSSTSEVFDPEVVSSICGLAQGIPRTINLLCYIALSVGHALSRKKVDGAVVEEIFSILGRQKPSARPRTERPTEGSRGAFTDRFGKSPLITMISYSLLAYSLLVWIIFFLNLE